MRRRRIDVETSESPAMQLTPMINVIIVIVAMFAGCANSARLEEHLGIKLPTFLFEKSAVAARQLNLEIKGNGQLRLEGKEVSAEELPRSLSIHRGAGVVIRPAPETRHEAVMQVLEICATAGISRVTFASSR